MKLFPITLALAASVLLSGCADKTPGGSASVGASSGAAKDSKSDATLSTGNERSLNQSAKANVTLPATSVIADATNVLLDWADLDADKYRSSYLKISGSPLLYAHTLAKKDISGLGQDKYARAAESLRKRIDADPDAPAIAAAKAKLACYEAGAQGADTKGCLVDLYSRFVAAMAVQSAHAARLEWEVNPLDGVTTAMQTYIYANAILAEFASVLDAEIAEQLNGLVLSDPADAQAAVIDQLFLMSIDRLMGIADTAVHTAHSNHKKVRLDYAGNGIGWITGNGTRYQAGESGWEIVRNGNVWFGKGKANGRSYDLAMENDDAVRRTYGDSSSKAATTTTTTKTDASVSTK